MPGGDKYSAGHFLLYIAFWNMVVRTPKGDSLDIKKYFYCGGGSVKHDMVNEAAENAILF